MQNEKFHNYESSPFLPNYKLKGMNLNTERHSLFSFSFSMFKFCYLTYFEVYDVIFINFSGGLSIIRPLQFNTFNLSPNVRKSKSVNMLI